MEKIHSRMEACLILGLPISATDTQIKTAFKELSKQYHPDAQPDARLHWQYYDMVEAYRYLMQTPADMVAPKVLGRTKQDVSWVSGRKESDAAYAKWEKENKKRKQEKQKAFKERQEQIRRDREYDEAMKQINAIRTARAIETLLDVATEINKEKDSKGI